MSAGRSIAMSVDPNVSNDVCSFCKYATFEKDGDSFLGDRPDCALGHTPYFRSLSNMGPIWVSDCKAGELRSELAAMDNP